MEYREFTAKNLDDAITEACETLMVTSDRLDYEVVSSGSSGFLGIGSKPAKIKARVKSDEMEEAKSVFNQDIFFRDSLFPQISRHCIRFRFRLILALSPSLRMCSVQ